MQRNLQSPPAAVPMMLCRAAALDHGGTLNLRWMSASLVSAVGVDLDLAVEQVRAVSALGTLVRYGNVSVRMIPSCRRSVAYLMWLSVV